MIGPGEKREIVFRRAFLVGLQPLALLLSYGPTYGFFTVTLTCITDHDSISLTLYGPGWDFNTDENGRLRIGDGYIDILNLLGKKRLMVYEEVIYETIDGEKKEYLRAVGYGWGGRNILK